MCRIWRTSATRSPQVMRVGEALISKTPQTGGLVSTATCKEQLLYELHDPARYLTPDVTADFTGRAAAAGRAGYGAGDRRQRVARPDTLKVTVGYPGGLDRRGPGLVRRAGRRRAGTTGREIVLDRLEYLGVRPIETRAEVVGVDSLYPGSGPTGRQVVGARRDGRAVRGPRPGAARVRTQEEAEMVVHEVDSLGLNGPSGGSIAARASARSRGGLDVRPRDLIRPSVTVEEVRASLSTLCELRLSVHMLPVFDGESLGVVAVYQFRIP